MKMYKAILIVLVCTLIGCERAIDEQPEMPILVPIDMLVSDEIELTLNPTGLTPLSASLAYSSPIPTQITATVLGGHPISSPPSDYNTTHDIGIHGLYSGTENLIKVEIKSEENGTLAIDTLRLLTDTLPDFFPQIDIIAKEDQLMEPGWNLMELSIGGQGYFRFYPSIFDPSGQVRYTLNLDFIQGWIGPFQRLNNGNWIWAKDHQVYEYDMLGRLVTSWSLGGYWQHHDIIEKPDGNLIIPVTKLALSTRLDYIIEIDRLTGDLIREWNLREVLDVDRFDIVWNSSDWAHVNSIWYDEATDGLVISARNQGVIKVDMDNHLQWIIAPHQGWELAGDAGDGIDTRDYLLTATNPDGIAYTDNIQSGEADANTFSWPWGQHAAMVLDNGNIFCFDNGTNRNFDGNSDYIRAVEYSIDVANMTIKQVWQYGKERGQELYSSNISDVDALPQTGNRLISPGNINSNGARQSRIIEVNYPEGDVVFEAVILFNNTLSTGGGWGDFDLSYRAERLELYPE